MTNALFGLVDEASGGALAARAWATQVAFFGVNAGLLGFVVGLMTQETALKRLFAPVMGVSILIVMAVFALRLAGEKAAATP